MRTMHILNSWRTHMLIVYFTQYGHTISKICRNHLRVLLIVWHILHMQIDMQTFHIILNILNMPKDSQNICDELKSTVVCRACTPFTSKKGNRKASNASKSLQHRLETTAKNSGPKDLLCISHMYTLYSNIYH
jgi:hypothetical protein